jgi:hypothetical protein
VSAKVRRHDQEGGGVAQPVALHGCYCCCATAAAAAALATVRQSQQPLHHLRHASHIFIRSWPGRGEQGEQGCLAVQKLQVSCT